MALTTANPDLTCPRCGYELSGTVGAWRDAAPLRFACSECGLVVDSAALLSGRLGGAGRFAEHARWVHLPLALPITFLAAHVTWILWRRLRIEHRIRPLRLVLLLIFTAMIAYLSVGVAVFADRTVSRGTFISSVQMAFPWALFLEPWSATPVWWIQHVLPPTPAAPTGRIPLSESSSELWQSFLNRSQPRLACFIVTASVLSTFAFAVLPHARRQAKVRAAQLFRAWCYLLVTLPACWALCVVVQRTGILRPYVLGSTMPGGLLEWWPGMIVLGCWLAWWWHLTSSRYLRMQVPFAVAMCVCALAILGTWTIGGVVLP